MVPPLGQYHLLLSEYGISSRPFLYSPLGPSSVPITRPGSSTSTYSDGAPPPSAFTPPTISYILKLLVPALDNFFSDDLEFAPIAPVV